MRTKIGVFIIPRFHFDSAVGGAENICRLVVQGLAEKYDIVVFHGELNLNAQLGVIQNHTEHIQSMNAFYLDEYSRQNGEISPTFCHQVEGIINECKVLLSFERVIIDLNIDQICILGGISYKHCVDIAQSNIWTQADSSTENSSVAEKTDVNILTIAGPTGIGMAKLMQDDEQNKTANDYAFTITSTPSDVLSAIMSGSADIAACPINLASARRTLYCNKRCRNQ